MARNCKKKKGDVNSDILMCDDVIIKSAPTALLINEYVASAIFTTILGSDYFQPTRLVRELGDDITLHIQRYSNVTTTASRLVDAFTYIKNENLPSSVLVGNARISKDFTKFSTVKNVKYTNSKIGDTEIKGFFTAGLATRLIYDADASSMANFAIVEDKDSYRVSRYDLDEGFSYLYKSNPAVVRKAPIAKLYPRASVDYMFNKDKEAFLGFHGSSIVGYAKFVFSNPIHNNLRSKFATFFNSLYLSSLNLQSIALEDAFMSVLKHNIDDLNSEISNKFNEVKAIVPAQTLDQIYNIKAIKQIGKDPLKLISAYDSSYDFIKPDDITKDSNVIKYCSKFDVLDPLDGVSKIVQCMNTIKYTQMLDTAYCYIASKFADYVPTLKMHLSLLPEISHNVVCHYPNMLNSKPCRFDSIKGISAEQEKCFMGGSVKLCDLYGDLEVCAQHLEL